ncbi:hypothetical protein PO909_010793 [Leuciscus waleckii]
MDDRCSESLHWNGGAALLFEAGARNIKQFSSFESGGENEPKAVFVVSTVLKGRTADIIKDIISLSHFQYCVVFTTVPHSLHLLANNVNADLERNPVFEQFEEKLCEWMGDMNYTSEVMHAPVFISTREESFSVGPMSRLIAGRKAAPNKASVVFVDRTLDLTGAVGHHGDNLVEKILSVLPQLPGHVTDVQVDMLELTHLKQTTDTNSILAPGCLAQNQ